MKTKDKDLVLFIDSLPLYKERLFLFLKSFIEENGLRPTARIIELSPGSLHHICNGKPVSVETLAGYVRKLLEFEKG